MYYSCRLEETKRKHLFQFSIQYFKSSTNTTLKVCQLLENWCQEFLTLTETPFHPWTEIVVLQTSLPLLNFLLLSPGLCTHGPEMGSQALSISSAFTMPLCCPCHCHPYIWWLLKPEYLGYFSGIHLSDLRSLRGSPRGRMTAIVSHRGVTALNYIFCKVLGGSLTKVISACKILQQNKLI